MGKGNLFVISGPSGVGKGSLMALLIASVNNIWLSISATTRKARPGEVNGRSYYFLSENEFQKYIDTDGFLEWANYTCAKYGTLKEPVYTHLNDGFHVFLEIEVEGARQVKRRCPNAHLIFIEPPSLDELRKRLEARHTEDTSAIEKRLEKAKLELSCKEEYDVSFVNDDLNDTALKLIDYVKHYA